MVMQEPALIELFLLDAHHIGERLYYEGVEYEVVAMQEATGIVTLKRNSERVRWTQWPLEVPQPEQQEMPL